MRVLSALDRGLEGLYRAAGVLAALFLVALAGLVIISIVSRLMGVFVPGVVEYSGYSMAASSFLALAYAFRRGSHIRVALLLSRLQGRWRRAGEIWCLVVASAFACYLAWYAVKLVLVSHDFEERSEGADATLLWIPQVGMAVGATVFAVCLVHGALRALLAYDAQAVESQRAAEH